jgi:dUTP pyrophosphatase
MKLKRIGEHPLVMPTRATDGSAGYDLSSAIDCEISPGNRMVIPTGFAWQIPECYAGQIWPRSGLAVKHGIDVLAGLIDNDYRGEVGVVLVNHGLEVFVIKQGDRVAQMVLVGPGGFVPCLAVTLDETERGNGGYGSTGK